MYLELRDPVFGYLLRLSGEYDLAEELTQETFCRALRALPKFRKESSLKTWLYAIARHTYLHHVRSKGFSLTPLDVENRFPREYGIGPEEQFIHDERRELVRKALYNLPETYRTVIILREFEELSYGEIGAILGQSENWCRVTFYRAKQKLKEQLCSSGREDGE